MLPSFKAPLLSKVGLRLSEEYGCCRQYGPHRAPPLWLLIVFGEIFVPSLSKSSAALTGASHLFPAVTMIEEIEFAPDAPLEEYGFELPVPDHAEFCRTSIPLVPLPVREPMFASAGASLPIRLK
jgi:hypothetical protein